MFSVWLTTHDFHLVRFKKKMAIPKRFRKVR
jgi:hypothetical protein